MEPKWDSCDNIFSYNISFDIISEMRTLSLNLSKNVDVEIVGQMKRYNPDKIKFTRNMKFLTCSPKTWRCKASWIKMVFVWKKNEKNEILRCKAWLVA
jgi:hypothetical protein